MSTISQFRGEHGFLSNFSYSPITVEDITYPTLEHAFQAAKTTDPVQRRYVAGLDAPGKAKRYCGRKGPITLRPDWEQVKVQVMRNLLSLKFAPGTEMASKLLSTGAATLIEGNTWGDRFWGVDLRTRKGANVLGKLLMERREELRRMATENPRRRNPNYPKVDLPVSKEQIPFVLDGAQVVAVISKLDATTSGIANLVPGEVARATLEHHGVHVVYVRSLGPLSFQEAVTLYGGLGEFTTSVALLNVLPSVVNEWQQGRTTFRQLALFPGDKVEPATEIGEPPVLRGPARDVNAGRGLLARAPWKRWVEGKEQRYVVQLMAADRTPAEIHGFLGLLSPAERTALQEVPPGAPDRDEAQQRLLADTLTRYYMTSRLLRPERPPVAPRRVRPEERTRGPLPLLPPPPEREFPAFTGRLPEKAKSPVPEVEAVISGGQTGADQGGLKAGERMGIPTGGWAPRGWLVRLRRTDDEAPAPMKEWLQARGLVENDEPAVIGGSRWKALAYVSRTARNVEDSDGTLWFGTVPTGRMKGGYGATVRALRADNKYPHLFFTVAWSKDKPFKPEDVYKFRDWLVRRKIKVLNVAGNEEGKNPGVQKAVEDFLVLALAPEKAPVLLPQTAAGPAPAGKKDVSGFTRPAGPTQPIGLRLIPVNFLSVRWAADYFRILEKCPTAEKDVMALMGMLPDVMTKEEYRKLSIFPAEGEVSKSGRIIDVAQLSRVIDNILENFDEPGLRDAALRARKGLGVLDECQSLLPAPDHGLLGEPPTILGSPSGMVAGWTTFKTLKDRSTGQREPWSTAVRRLDAAMSRGMGGRIMGQLADGSAVAYFVAGWEDPEGKSLYPVMKGFVPFLLNATRALQMVDSRTGAWRRGIEVILPRPEKVEGWEAKRGTRYPEGVLAKRLLGYFHQQWFSLKEEITLPDGTKTKEKAFGPFFPDDWAAHTDLPLPEITVRFDAAETDLWYGSAEWEREFASQRMEARSRLYGRALSMGHAVRAKLPPAERFDPPPIFDIERSMDEGEEVARRAEKVRSMLTATEIGGEQELGGDKGRRKFMREIRDQLDFRDPWAEPLIPWGAVDSTVVVGFLPETPTDYKGMFWDQGDGPEGLAAWGRVWARLEEFREEKTLNAQVASGDPTTIWEPAIPLTTAAAAIIDVRKIDKVINELPPGEKLLQQSFRKGLQAVRAGYLIDKHHRLITFDTEFSEGVSPANVNALDNWAVVEHLLMATVTRRGPSYSFVEAPRGPVTRPTMKGFEHTVAGLLGEKRTGRDPHGVAVMETFTPPYPFALSTIEKLPTFSGSEGLFTRMKAEAGPDADVEEVRAAAYQKYLGYRLGPGIRSLPPQIIGGRKAVTARLGPGSMAKWVGEQLLPSYKGSFAVKQRRQFYGPVYTAKRIMDETRRVEQDKAAKEGRGAQTLFGTRARVGTPEVLSHEVVEAMTEMGIPFPSLVTEEDLEKALEKVAERYEPSAVYESDKGVLYEQFGEDANLTDEERALAEFRREALSRTNPGRKPRRKRKPRKPRRSKRNPTRKPKTTETLLSEQDLRMAQAYLLERTGGRRKSIEAMVAELEGVEAPDEIKAALQAALLQVRYDVDPSDKNEVRKVLAPGWVPPGDPAAWDWNFGQDRMTGDAFRKMFRAKGSERDFLTYGRKEGEKGRLNALLDGNVVARVISPPVDEKAERELMDTLFEHNGDRVRYAMDNAELTLDEAASILSFQRAARRNQRTLAASTAITRPYRVPRLKYDGPRAFTNQLSRAVIIWLSPPGAGIAPRVMTFRRGVHLDMDMGLRGMRGKGQPAAPAATFGQILGRAVKSALFWVAESPRRQFEPGLSIYLGRIGSGELYRLWTAATDEALSIATFAKNLKEKNVVKIPGYVGDAIKRDRNDYFAAAGIVPPVEFAPVEGKASVAGEKGREPSTARELYAEAEEDEG